MKNKVKITIPSGPVVLSQYTAEIEAYKLSADESRQQLQDVVTEYQTLGLGTPTAAELERLFINQHAVEDHVRAKLAGNEPVTVGDIKISPAKFQQMIEIPDLSGLNKAISRARKYNPEVVVYDAETGQVSLNHEAIKVFEDSQTRYLTSDAEKEIYLAALQIQESAQCILEKYGVSLFSRYDPAIILSQHPAYQGDPGQVFLNKAALSNRLREISR